LTTTDLELGVRDAGFLTERNLFLLVDRSRGVRDVGLTGAEALEAAARSGNSHRHLHIRLLLAERLCCSGRERADRARPVDLDVAGKLLFGRGVPGRLGRLCSVRVVVLPAAPHCPDREHREGQQEEDNPRQRANTHCSPFAS
jgi:hypothetical protein